MHVSVEASKEKEPGLNCVLLLLGYRKVSWKVTVSAAPDVLQQLPVAYHGSL